MLHKHFKYVDYLGEEREEDAYFNLNAAELTKLNSAFEGGFQAAAKKAKESRDAGAIINMFNIIISTSYGILSDDGRRLMKRNGQLAEEFKETPAFMQFFEEVVTVDGAFDKFLKAIMPSDEELRRYENVVKKAKEAAAQQG